MTITISAGRSHDGEDGAKVTRVKLSSMSALAKRLQRKPSTVDGGSYITAAPMRNGKRSGANADPATIIGLDFDDLTPSASKAIRKAAGKFSSIIFETRNSTSEKPRLRVLMQAASKIKHQDYPAAHDAAVAALSEAAGVTVVADQHCAKSEQPLFCPIAGRAVELHGGRKFSPPKPVAVNEPELLKPGRRNVDLTSVAGTLRNRGLNRSQLEAALLAINSTGPKPLRESEVKSIARSVSKYPAPDSKVGMPIVLRTALDIVENPVATNWLLRPYLEQDVLAVMAGEYGTFKSFLSLDWALHISAGTRWHGDTRESSPAQPVVFISAEGRGLAKRVRAWAQHHFPDEATEDVLRRLKFFAIEMAIDLSSADRVTALISAIDGLDISPVLIVVDTLTKNSSGVEDNNSAMQTFLNTINDALRMRYRCTVLLIHHVGHSEKDRARGPYSLVANTDASFIVKRIDPWNVELFTDRLKDSEPPVPLSLEARVVPLASVDQDGNAESSLVLVHGAPHLRVRLRPSGENQGKVWDVLSASDQDIYSKKDLWALARTVIDKVRVTETIGGMRKAGYLSERDQQWEFHR